AAAVAGRHAEHGVGRQVGIQGAQAVCSPRADGRVRAALADVPAGVPLQLGAVVVVGRPQRADDGKVIGAGADVLPPVGDGEAGLAVLLEAGVQAHELAAAAVGGVGGDDVLDARVGEDVLVGRRVDALAGVLVQLGLDVEALDVADAAAEEDPDDVL